MHVVTCHAPTNISSDEEITKFYSDRSECIQSFPPHDIVVIAGDLNAHLGRDLCNLNAFYDKTNRNGKMLLEFCQENNLSIGALKFNKKLPRRLHGLPPMVNSTRMIIF